LFQHGCLLFKLVWDESRRQRGLSNRSKTALAQALRDGECLSLWPCLAIRICHYGFLEAEIDKQARTGLIKLINSLESSLPIAIRRDGERAIC
jgi:hypothetical protein